MRFYKYEGIGNDFIVIDGIRDHASIDADLCRRMCDRNFGIGADGILFVLPGQDGSDITMRILNSDGSEAIMCGNGIRCVAKFAYDNGLVKKSSFVVNTLRGNLGADVTVKDGKVDTVMIDMGAPMPEKDYTVLDIDGLKVKGRKVSMGNPHFVTFDRLEREQIDRLGPILESHKEFPDRTNVEFVSVRDGKIDIRVYERGAAWTLACGTGACATTTAAAIDGLVPFDQPVDVHLPGGWLRITVDGKLRNVRMEGPARYVFQGEYQGE